MALTLTVCITTTLIFQQHNARKQTHLKVASHRYSRKFIKPPAWDFILLERGKISHILNGPAKEFSCQRFDKPSCATFFFKYVFMP